MGRLIEASISLIEALIERLSDPSRERFLEQCLSRADHTIAELASENVRLERENSGLRSFVDRWQVKLCGVSNCTGCSGCGGSNVK